MRKPRGAAFKGSYRFKRIRSHHGKRKVTKTAEVPYYVVTVTDGTVKGVQYLRK